MESLGADWLTSLQLFTLHIPLLLLLCSYPATFSPCFLLNFQFWKWIPLSNTISLLDLILFYLWQFCDVVDKGNQNHLWTQLIQPLGFPVYSPYLLQAELSPKFPVQTQNISWITYERAIANDLASLEGTGGRHRRRENIFPIFLKR